MFTKGKFVSYLYEFLPDFPREDTRIIPFHVLDPRLDLGGSDPRFTAADHAGFDRAGFLVAIQDFRDASMGHAELP